MTELSKKIIQKIERENIKPYSKWHFLFKRSVIWTLFMISVLSGALSSGVLIYQFQNTEWNLYEHYNHSLLEFIMIVIPYFWIVFLILFSILVFYYFRRTESGYRKNTAWVIFITLFLSFAGGAALNQMGLSEKVETSFQKRVPFYRSMIERRRRMWSAPRRGLLAGKIIKIEAQNNLLLVDFHKRVWQIDISEARIRGRMALKEELRIKIIGKITGNLEFKAREIRPWMGRGMRRRPPMNRRMYEHIRE